MTLNKGEMEIFYRTSENKNENGKLYLLSANYTV